MRGWFVAVRHWLACRHGDSFALNAAEASEWPRVITPLFYPARTKLSIPFAMYYLPILRDFMIASRINFEIDPKLYPY